MSAAGFDGGKLAPCQNAGRETTFISANCYIKSLLKIGNEENGGDLNYFSSEQVLLFAVHIKTKAAFDHFAIAEVCGFLFTQLQMATCYKANNLLTTSHVFDGAKMLKTRQHNYTSKRLAASGHILHPRILWLGKTLDSQPANLPVPILSAPQERHH